MIKYGFTGTRTGLSPEQKSQVFNLLSSHISKNESIEVHHGDCVGADKEFNDICLQLHQTYPNANIRIIVHPSINVAFSTHSTQANSEITTIQIPLPSLMRDKLIVNQTDKIIGCPRSSKEIIRSSTWATIRYARKHNRPIFVF